MISKQSVSTILFIVLFILSSNKLLITSLSNINSYRRISIPVKRESEIGHAHPKSGRNENEK